MCIVKTGNTFQEINFMEFNFFKEENNYKTEPSLFIFRKISVLEVSHGKQHLKKNKCGILSNRKYWIPKKFFQLCWILLIHESIYKNSS